MKILIALLMTQFGVQINNPNPDKIEIVRTDQQPPENHNRILDDPRYSHLMPFTVTVKTGDLAIKTINVVFDVVEYDGTKHSFGHIYTEDRYGTPVIGRNSSSDFWPGGRLPKILAHPNPIIQIHHDMDMIEHAASVTFSIDYVQFEDNSIIGPNKRRTAESVNRGR